MQDLELSGEWRAIESSASASGFHSQDFDDSDWHSIDVPSHWSGHDVLASNEGSVHYRKTFEAQPESAQRSWLQFNGVFTHASVWVDGAYSGEIDGYFANHSFEITEALASRSQHLVAVEVNAPSFDVPWSSPGGIWKPVLIKHTGVVRIARVRVLCSEAREERGVLSCHIELDAAIASDVTIRTVVTPVRGSHGGGDVEITRRLAAGSNRLSWHVTIDSPELWWPWSLGNQAFFEVSIEVTDARTPHQISDSTKVRTGFRQVSHERGITIVNGERLFVQSIEAGNDGTPPIETDHTYFLDVIQKRRDVGANLLVRSHWIEPSAFYDVADELGMLVLQGIPSGADKNPLPRHARQMVEVLGHHPSIGVWLRPPKRIVDRRPAPDSIKRALDKSDSTRANIEQPLGWDLNRLDGRDILAIVPKWTKRSHFLYFTSDPREAAGHIDAVRLLKYRPLGGFIAPLALPELLDGACDPLRLIALPKEELVANEAGEIDVFILNDTRLALTEVVVSAWVDDQEWSWGGDVSADGSSFIGTVKLLPADSELTITLRLKSASESSERVVRLPVKRSMS